MNNFKDFLEAYSLSKIYKIVLEYTLKSSQLISSSDNKKILLTTRNVRLDSGHYATKYHSQIEISALCEICTQGCMYLKLVTKQARSNLIFSWSKHLINLRKPVLEVCPLWQGLLSNDGGQKISGNFDF